MPKQKTVMDNDLKQKQYFATIDLWKHHNDILLKWPQVIIGASILFLATLANNQAVAALLAQPQQWGMGNFLELATGSLLLLFGLAILTMLYVMRRAKTVMANVEAELNRRHDKN